MDSALRCTICSKTFTQKSSLVRHSKRCSPGPAPSLRQKSCRACTASKTKCDLQRPRCARCEQRDTLCEYVVPMTRGTRVDHSREGHKKSHTNEQVAVTLDDMVAAGDFGALALPGVSSSMLRDGDISVDSDFSPFEFGAPPLTSASPLYNILASRQPQTSIWDYPTVTTPLAGMAPMLASFDVQNSYNAAMMTLCTPPEHEFNDHDWLLWSKGHADSTPPLVRHSMETLLRVMKTWPRTLAKGFQTPPFLHNTHTNPKTILQPMINCIAISKLWSNQGEGASEPIRQTILQEMRLIFENYRLLDERSLLSALQALTMYTIMMMYPGYDQRSVSLIDPAIFFCLQKTVSYVAKTGLMLTEERDNERPSWESWIHVTAKRRAVFSLYLLHWSYAVYHGLESFACSQLGFMPAPAPKFLWQETNKAQWEVLYDGWLAQWGDRPYTMHEFAAIQAGASLERRSETWLEDADELGVLFFSIVNATDREDPVHEFGKGIDVLS
ncbi:hypothetical protein BKA66DRAFT_473686 [Pyrenochaeta sp. MPI-SDFR-AT-0127]|nr:hypothetical protein BKA66DRAFT_473686 [Pyrenochaeta sp. MPI-SDFR-AT-0127]